ncbi:hypothetical protein AM352_02795 [Citrobacter koseri]|nr:hypothetical protein AM352_02795 [Citrobacter koseri]
MRRVTHCQIKRRPDKVVTPPSGDMPGGAALTGPTNHRRADKAVTPPSGDMPGGAALAGPTNHRRPDKAFTPPSGITPRLPACGYAS